MLGYYQKKVLQNQFKAAYSLFSQLILRVESDLGYKPDCYYWNVKPYPAFECDKDQYGACIAGTHRLPDGSPLPSDYNGRMNGPTCKFFFDTFFSNVEIITICNGNAFAKGCIPEYEGYDTVQQINNPDLSDEKMEALSGSCPWFKKDAILNQNTVYVLKNGIIVVLYGNSKTIPIFAIDINGKKGPNKWGYDLFSFVVTSNDSQPLQLIKSSCMTPEKGGMSTENMIKNMYN